MKAFLFYFDDWLNSDAVGEMDGDEECGYLRLLAYCWKQPDCGMPINHKLLAQKALLNDQWELETRDQEFRYIPGETSGQKILKSFFVVENGVAVNATTKEPVEFDRKSGVDVSTLAENRLYNSRLLREWNFQREYWEKKSKAGRDGANARWQKNGTGMADALADALPTQCVGNANARSVSVSLREVKDKSIPENGAKTSEQPSNVHPFPVSQNTRALAELNDWSKPDIQELAKSLAIELQPNHPKFADRTRAEISIRTCLLNCLDPAAECAEIRARHSDLVEEFEAELRMNPKAWLPRLEDWISGLGYKQKIRKRTRGALALNHDPYEELK